MTKETYEALLALAIEKSKRLTPGTHIRLTSDPASYWVWNLSGVTYIGYYLEGVHNGESEPEFGDFFSNAGIDKCVYLQRDKNDKVIARLQKL